MLNVICVRVGQKFKPDYVYKLKNMVSRHLNEEHKFICMTDNPWQVPGIECIQPPMPICDSWCKIGLFSPNVQIAKGDRVLYLDLDVVIIGSLDELIKDKLQDVTPVEVIDKASGENLNKGIASGNKDLWIAKDWRDPFNSSVMYWVNGQQCKIFGKFKSKHIEELRGDQNLIAQIVPEAKTFRQKDILSYKFSGVHERDEKPKGKIVLFHGRPKMHDLPNVQWLNEEWR